MLQLFEKSDKSHKLHKLILRLQPWQGKEHCVLNHWRSWFFEDCIEYPPGSWKFRLVTVEVNHLQMQWLQNFFVNFTLEIACGHHRNWPSALLPRCFYFSIPVFYVNIKATKTAPLVTGNTKQGLTANTKYKSWLTQLGNGLLLLLC